MLFHPMFSANPALHGFLTRPNPGCLRHLHSFPPETDSAMKHRKGRFQESSIANIKKMLSGTNHSISDACTGSMPGWAGMPYASAFHLNSYCDVLVLFLLISRQRRRP